MNESSVLLINPKQTYRRENVWGTISNPGIPLGLGYLASYLRQGGIEVSVIDANRENLSASCIARRLPESKPSIVGVTTYTPGCVEAYDIVRICKQKYSHVNVVTGGPHVSAVPDEALDIGAVDFVVRGEGEQTFLELANGREPSRIPGLSFRKDGEVSHNTDRRPLPALDEIPFPAYDLLNPKLYGVTAGRARRHPAASIITSRGCPYSCHFCQSPGLGKLFRSRSAENVLAEIQLLTEHYGIFEFAFQDDVLTVNRTNLLHLCELIPNRDLDVSWSCLSRVDTIDGEMLRAMKAAGCHQIGFGVESGSDTILRSIGKNTTVAQAQEAVRLAQQEGLEVVTYFILGLPGETRETLLETLRLSLALRPDYCVYNIAVPFPGTHMYEEASRDSRLRTTDWTRFNTSEAVLEVPGLSAAYIEKFYRRAYLRFYFDPRTLIRRLKKTRSLSNLFQGLRSGVRLLRQ